MAHQPESEAPEATMAPQEALRELYSRIALVAGCFRPDDPVRFHLVKAGERVVRALQAQVRRDARGN